MKFNEESVRRVGGFKTDTWWGCMRLAYAESLEIGEHDMWLTPPLRFLFLFPRAWLTDLRHDVLYRVKRRMLRPRVVR